MVKQKWREDLALGSSSASSKRPKGPCESHLMEWIMSEVYCLGEGMSWQKAQACAHAAVLDGLKDEHLLELASMSSFGNHRNFARDSKWLTVVQEEACAAIGNLAFTYRGNATIIGSVGGSIDAVLGGMNEHPEASNLQFYACGALGCHQERNDHPTCCLQTHPQLCLAGTGPQPRGWPSSGQAWSALLAARLVGPPFWS